jgi:outer membrane protein assembly factor BamA
MTHLQFSIAIFGRLIIGLAFLNSPALDSVAGSPVVVQSAEETRPGRPGRPTLSVRQPVSDPGSPSVRHQPPPKRDESPNWDISAKVANDPKVRFEGLQAFTVTEALKLFRDRRVWSSTDHMPTSDLLARAVTVLKGSLEARGYMQAIVEARQDEESKTIVLMVSEGPRFSIGDIRFQGNRLFSSQELAARMRELLQHYEESTNGYDTEIFDVCLRQLSNFIRSRGYLQVRLGEPKKELIGGGLVVTVPVEEGALYRLGEIKIEGAENFTKEQVRAMLSLQREDIASAEAIGKWLYHDLRNLYGELGYIQYTGEIDPEFRLVDQASKEGVVDFNVTIDEGRQFRIRSIRFDGSDISERELHTLLLIRPGDVFNQLLFEKSVNQLNETKWFEMIDKDKDTDFKTHEEEALLDITLRLKRVERPQIISW